MARVPGDAELALKLPAVKADGGERLDGDVSVRSRWRPEGGE